MNNLTKCIFCGTVVIAVGADLYCGCNELCKKYNPRNESYIRKPVQQYSSNYARSQLESESFWTSSGNLQNSIINFKEINE